MENAPWTSYLFLHGEDDQAVSPEFTDRMVQRLKKANLSNYTVKRYPGAGHMIEIPYHPVMRSVYSGWYSEYDIGFTSHMMSIIIVTCNSTTLIIIMRNGPTILYATGVMEGHAEQKF